MDGVRFPWLDAQYADGIFHLNAYACVVTRSRVFHTVYLFLLIQTCYCKGLTIISILNTINSNKSK